MTTADNGPYLVLFGPPGSGKGTQAEHICEEFGLVHVSTGNIFRENLKNETELGKLAKKYMDAGDLVPDDVTAAMVRDRLAQPDAQAGYILDGFPRTIPQAAALDDIVAENDLPLDGVVHIKVSDEEVIRRLSGRLMCRECQASFHKEFNPFETCPYDKCEGEYLYQRDDDKPETIRARLQTFHEQTAPLIDYYQKQDLMVEVEGEGPVSEVTGRTLSAIRQLI